MAIRHCSVKRGKVGNGAAHSRYIAGEGKYADREDVVEIFDRNLPTWATDATDFFAAADDQERANGRTYTEVEFAIPREVADPASWASDFACSMLGEAHPYRLAIHSKIATDGGPNTHGHLMFSERKLDGVDRSRDQFFRRGNSKDPAKGGTAKDRSWNERGAVQRIRDLFSGKCREAGIEVDMRSNIEQGLDAPEPKIGPKIKGHMRVVRQLAQQVLAIRSERRELAEAKAELAVVQAEINRASQEPTEARRTVFAPRHARLPIRNHENAPEAREMPLPTPVDRRQELELFAAKNEAHPGRDGQRIVGPVLAVETMPSGQVVAIVDLGRGDKAAVLVAPGTAVGQKVKGTVETGKSLSVFERGAWRGGR